jgi:H+/Cl- antiporter ClcA
LASLAFGAVLGPEAPLIALGGGLAVLLLAPLPRPIPPEGVAIVAAAGSFAAISLIFGNPIIAAVLLLEIAGLGRDRIPLMLLPGLVAAAVGSLIYLGLGSWTGLSTTAYSIPPIHLPDYARPRVTDFLWTIPLAAVVAVGAVAIILAARRLHAAVARRPLLLIPLAGLAVAGLAIAFDAMTDRGIDEVLFSGQSSLPDLTADAAGWSAAALAALLLCKGVAWSISLSSFRGGPIFPSMLLGAAGGILAADLPGFALTPAVAVGIGAAVAAAIRLPLAAALLAVILTASSGPGATPLIIVGVAVAFLVAAAMDRTVRPAEPSVEARRPEAAAAPPPAGP